MDVREIIRIEEITKLPDVEEYIKGVINLRGGIIVIIDLAMKLGLPVKESDNNTRIIVVDIDNSSVGMIVDSATEVLRLNGKDIKSAPSIITRKINASYLEGVGVVGDRLLILLNLAKVMGDTDFKKITESSGSSELSKEEVEEVKQEIQSDKNDETKESEKIDAVTENKKMSILPAKDKPVSKKPKKKTSAKKLAPKKPIAKKTNAKKSSNSLAKSKPKSVSKKSSAKKASLKKPASKKTSKKSKK
jgi:purine-binding chemotaxis protein CheW